MGTPHVHAYHRAVRAGVAVTLLGAALVLGGCTETRPAPPPNALGTAADVPTVALQVAACEPAGWCVGAGANPTATSPTTTLEISHGGHEHWVPGTVPQLASATLSAAACWSTHCLLGGASPAGSVLVLVDPATRVASTLAAPPGDAVDALACPSAGHCLALVGTATATLVDVTDSSGTSWSADGTLPDALAAGSTLACRSVLDCVAAGAGQDGAAMSVTTDGGRVWRLVALPPVLSVVTSAACAAGIGCLATARQRDGAFALLRASAVTGAWHLAASPLPGPAAVACAPGLCVLGGGARSGALAALATASGWRPLTVSYVDQPVVGLGCATPERCAAVTPASTVSIAP